MKPYVPDVNVNKTVENAYNDTLLHIKCQKCSGSHYARDCKNKIGGVLHNLQEEPTVEDIAGTLQIYGALDGQQGDHKDTMVEIEGKILNTSISILIDPSACRTYVPPKFFYVCKLGKVKHDKPWMVQLAKNTKWKVS